MSVAICDEEKIVPDPKGLTHAFSVKVLWSTSICEVM